MMKFRQATCLQDLSGKEERPGQSDPEKMMEVDVKEFWDNPAWLQENMAEVVQGKICVQGPVQQKGGPSGSFNRALRAWEALPGVDPRVLFWLRNGIDERPGAGCKPMPWNLWGGEEFNVTKNEEEEQWLRDEHRRWLKEGISEPVDDNDWEGFWHPLKVVPKAGWQQLPPEAQWLKKYRLCVAVARTLNESLEKPRLKMETLAMALRLIDRDDHMVVGDLDAGYNHMLLHPECRRYYRYRVDGKSFQMRVLFFGLATAPYIFSTTVSQLWKFLRRPQSNEDDVLDVKKDGLKVTGFIDDLLVVEQVFKMAEALKRWVWPVSGALGFCWGRKCRWTPALQAKYLGLVIDTGRLRVLLPKDKADQMVRAARYALKRPKVQVATILRLVGRLRAAALAIPNTPVLAWELGRLVGPAVREWIPDPRELSSRLLSLLWRGILSTKVALDEGAQKSLKWIQSHIGIMQGRPWTDEGLKWLVVDASTDRAGARLEGMSASIPFPDWLVKHLQDSQARREVQGALLGLQAFRAELEGRRVALLSDNKGQVAVFNHMRNGALAPWVAEALWFCMEHQIEVHKASWIPAREMVRRGVDGLSRLVDVNDWQLKSQIWERVCQWASGLEVDRFADSINAKLRRWNSRFHEPGSEAVDALVQCWAGVRNYACPPLALMGQVIELLRRQRPCAVLIVPKWTGQVWWPVLRRMAPREEDWLFLGKGWEIFDLGRSGMAAPLRHNWEFLAVRVFWM
jgi:hypothetical protein